MNGWIDRILSLAAPHICKGCGQVGATLCERCNFNILREKYQKCVNCARDLTNAELARCGNLCSSCAKSLPFSRIFVVGERRAALMKLVGDFKYNSERASARIIAKLLDQAVPPLENAVIITSIPTAPAHIRTRGFDHAKLIAQNFATIRRLKFADLLFRETNSSQHNLNAADRKNLARQMFSLRAKIPPKILLIDDIWTTGATTTTAAQLLKKSGAREIDLAIVARQTHGTHRKFAK
jgi:ComF family protein